MKKIFTTMLAAVLCMSAGAAKKGQTAQLQFDASKGVAGSVTMAHGGIVNYTAFTKLYY